MKDEFVATLVVYDISDNKTRNKIIKILESCGLSRLQFSVFLGETTFYKLKYLKRKIEELQKFFEPQDSVIIIPIDKDILHDADTIGKVIRWDDYLNDNHFRII